MWDLLGKSGPGRAQVDSDRVVPWVVTWNALVAELLGVTQPDFRFKLFLLGERVINVRFSSRHRIFVSVEEGFRLLRDFRRGHDRDLRTQVLGAGLVSWAWEDLVYVLHVAAEVAALRERLGALRTLERPHSGVLSEVVPQVATLLEDAVTTLNLAFEEQLYTLGRLVLHLNSFVPFVRNPRECLDVTLLVLRVRPLRALGGFMVELLLSLLDFGCCLSFSVDEDFLRIIFHLECLLRSGAI